MRLIDADALIADWKVCMYEPPECVSYPGDAILRIINRAPTFSESKMAHWEPVEWKGGLSLRCSNCGIIYRDHGDGIYTDTCPRCGAIMRGVEDDEGFAYDEFCEQAEEK